MMRIEYSDAAMLPSAQVFPRTPIVSAMAQLALDYPEDRLLRAVGRYHFLTVYQLLRLLGYKQGTKRTVEKRLAALEASGHLIRKRGYTQGPGQAPAIFVLGPEGRDYLKKSLPLRRRFRPSDTWRRDFLEHVLGLNDVLIAAERLAEDANGLIWLAEMQHDQILQETPFVVSMPNGQTASLVPDAWLDFRFPRAGQRPLRECYWVEFDRGTERQDAFRDKIRKIIALSINPASYEERFATNNLTVAFVTWPEHQPELRRDMLLSWIRDEQRRSGELRPDLFFVTALDAAVLSPQEVYCAPVWMTPFAEEPMPLIEPPEGGA
jgi:DNA-binding MarR family transcriptional regulator